MSEAAEISQQLHHQIKKLQIPHPQSKVSPYVTLSVGVSSLIPSQKYNPDDFIHQTDLALYQAKRQGRNQTVTIQIE